MSDPLELALFNREHASRLSDEVDALRAEIERLNSELTDALTDLDSARQDNSSFTAEFASPRLRAEVERLRADVQTRQGHAKTAIWSDSEECKLLTADNERLNSELTDALTDLNSARQDNASCTVHIHNQADRIEKLEAQVAKFIEQANTKCACAHDKPEDVCLAHSPIVAKQAAEIESLRAGNRDLQLWFDDLKIEYDKQAARIEKLEAALREIKQRKDYQLPSAQDIAAAALEERT